MRSLREEPGRSGQRAATQFGRANDFDGSVRQAAQGVCGASWGINKVGVSQKPIKTAASRHVQWPIGARCLPMFCTALLIFLLCLPYTQPTVASADHSSTGVYTSIVDHKIA